MSNCLLCWPDHTQGTDYQTPVLSGGSWETALPLANLQDTALATLARTTDTALASTKVSIDLQIGRDVRVVTLLKHNLSQDGKVRITAANDAGFTDVVYQTAWLDAWPVFYDIGDLPWGYPGLWSGVLAAEEVDGYTMQFIHVLTAAVWAQYWRVEIDDTTNTAGYIELARVSLWAAWQPDTNMCYGAQLGFETDTVVDHALSGTAYFDRRHPARVATFKLVHIDPQTALKKPFEMMRKLGVDGQLFFVFDPEDSQADMFRRAFLANLRKLSPLEYPAYNANTHAYELKEVL